MKRVLALALAMVMALSLAACGKKSDSGVKILVPNDTTNEARALLLLQENAIITLKDGVLGLTRSRLPTTATEVDMRPPLWRYSRVSTMPNTRMRLLAASIWAAMSGADIPWLRSCSPRSSMARWATMARVESMM